MRNKVKLTYSEWSEFENERIPYLPVSETPITKKLLEGGVDPHNIDLSIEHDKKEKCLYVFNGDVNEV